MARPAAVDPLSIEWREVWRCSIRGTPVPKGRPRVGRNGRAFTPKRTRDWEASAVAQMLADATRPHLLDCPLMVMVMVFLPRPKSLRRKKDHPGAVFAPVRPDADNFAKAALDALQGAEVIADDGMIVQLRVAKYYAAIDREPGLIIVMCVPHGHQGSA